MNLVTLGPVLVAVHMTGDYILQSAYMAAHKLTDWRVRMIHVLVYTLVFSAAMLMYEPNAWRYNAACLWVGVTHFLTDSKRWRTSNPWPSMPILQDQSLHAVELAVAAVILFG